MASNLESWQGQNYKQYHQYPAPIRLVMVRNLEINPRLRFSSYHKIVGQECGHRISGSPHLL